MEKLKVDLLIINGDILTMNLKGEVITNGGIAIKNNNIVDIGNASDILDRYSADETIDATDQIVMPGLIDTHFHTAQQFERNLLPYLKKETDLRDPIWQYALIPFEGSLTDEDIYLSAKLAYTNMIKVGTTCFADPGGPKPEIMAEALKTAGIRGTLARSTLDEIRDIPETMQDTIEGIINKGENLHKEWDGKADGRVRVWMAMREIMVCSSELITALKETADHLNTGLHIHLGEHPSEVDYAIAKSGLRPTHYLNDLGVLGSNIHAAHSSLLSNSELDLYQQYDISVAHCPAIAFSFCGPTKVPEMLQRGLRVGIGTDGAMSSGGSLDLLRQMTITRFAQTALFGLPYHEDLSFIDDHTLLRMATIEGAKALQWDSVIGSLEIGKSADIIMVNFNELDSLPIYDPTHCAASILHGANVDTVVVNGKILMRGRVLLDIDEDQLRAEVRERTPLILKRFLESI